MTKYVHGDEVQQIVYKNEKQNSIPGISSTELDTPVYIQVVKLEALSVVRRNVLYLKKLLLTSHDVMVTNLKKK